jgi:hypothetical protein
MEQGIELAGGEQLIEPAQTVEHALLDLALDALAFSTTSRQVQLPLV